MKKVIIFLIIIAILALIGSCVGGDSSSSSSYSSGNSRYDSDADYVADQFGVDSNRVNDSVGALGDAMH